MKLHDARLEHGLRRRVRDAVRASPRLRKLSARDFWKMHRHLAGWAFRWLLPLFVVALVMGKTTAAWAVESKLTAVAFLLATIHAMQAMIFGTTIRANSDTPALWYFTADESLTFRWCWRAWWHGPAWAAYDAACVLAMLDSTLAGPRAGWPGIAMLAAMYGLLSAGWITRPWAWFDKALAGGMFLLIIACVFLRGAVTAPLAGALPFAEHVALLFPAGWLLRAFAEWRAGGAGVWFAAFGCIALVFAGLHPRFRAAWKKPFQDAWTSAGDAASDEAGDESDYEEHADFSPAQPAVSPEEINACAEATRSRDYLEPAPEEGASRLVRRVTASLTPRERLLVEAFAEGVPDYFGIWFRAARTQVKWWLGIALVHWLGLDALRNIALVFGVFAALAILPASGFLPRFSSPSQDTPGGIALGLAMPVSLREIPPLERKLAWPFLLVALPWCALIGLALAFVFRHAPADGAIFGAKVAILSAAARPLFRCIGMGKSAGGSGCGYLLCGAILLIAAGASAAVCLFASLPWSLVAVPAVWFSCHLLWCEYLRRWKKV